VAGYQEASEKFQNILASIKRYKLHNIGDNPVYIESFSGVFGRVHDIVLSGIDLKVAN
jgi:hypothetical protein